MRGKYTLNFDLAHATVQQHNDESSLGAREFKVLTNWIPHNGVLIQRETFNRLFDTAQSGIGTWNQGLHAMPQSANTCWLLAMQADANGFGRPWALNLDFAQTDPANIVRQNIPAGPNALEQLKSLRPGQNWSFCEYRGNVFVSDGFQTWAWDGQVWRGPNNSNGNGLPVARQFAFHNAIEFEGRLALCGTTAYGNELTWTDIWADVDVNQEWTGNPQLGELAGTNAVTTLLAMSFGNGVGYVGGIDGTLIYTRSSGKIWVQQDPPDKRDVRGLAETMMSGTAATWVVLADNEGVNPQLYYYTNGAWTFGNLPGSYPSRIWRLRLRRQNDGTSYMVLGVAIQVMDPFPSENSGVYFTHDYGMTWTYAETASGGIGCTDAVWDNSSGTYVATYITGNVDKGFVWVNGVNKLEVGKRLWAIGRSGARMAVVGDGGYVYHSNDSFATYTDDSGIVTENLHDCIAVNAITFIAVGDSGTVLRGVVNTGTNVWTWTEIADVGTSANLHAVDYDGAYVYACGDVGVVIRSDDLGETWEQFTESENRFTKSVMVGTNEDIRDCCKTKGMLYIFTDKAAYSYNSQFGQNVVTPGLVVAGPRCVQAYFGALWVLGHYLGRAGLWKWDGFNAPELMSEEVEDYINAAQLYPVPRRQWFICDSETDFTPHNGGITYDHSDNVTYDYGVLRLKQGKTVTIYSHGNGVSAPITTTGFYLPDKSAAVIGDFGYLTIEMALNDQGTTDQSWMKVSAQYGKDNGSGGIVWSNWILLHNALLPYDAMYTNQGAVPGRLAFQLNVVAPEVIPPYDDYQYVQFKIEGYRSNSLNTNWFINRIAICSTVRDLRNSGVTPPYTYIFENRLYAMLGNGTGIVASYNGESLACITENHPVAAVTTCNRIVQALSSGSIMPDIRYNWDGEDVDGYVQTLQTGRLGLLDTSRSILLRKKPRTVVINAIPALTVITETIMNLNRWSNGESGAAVSKELLFRMVHQPANGLLQIRGVAIPSAPSSTASYGNDFTVQLVTTSTFSPARLKMLAIDFDTEDEEGRPTD